MTIVDLDRRAVEAAGRMVARVRSEHLEQPSICEGWTVRDLLEHMVAQHRGFAIAAGGQPSGLAVWRPRPVGADVSKAYDESAALVIAAFAAEGVIDRDFWLPEISTERSFPARTAIGFHFSDYLAHGWDVAASIGATFQVDDDLVQAALPIAESVPQTPAVRGPGRAFAPVVDVPAGAPALDRFLALMGRDPAARPS